MTLIALEAIGARERVTSFPAEAKLDSEVLDEISIDNVVSLSFWEDVLDAAREAGRGDLEELVVPVVTRAKAALGLPRSYRRRHRPGPPPLGAAGARQPRPARTTEPRLFATPETAAAMAEAETAALLVGGYDGSGNFGDILILDAALELLGPLEPGLLPLPILERRFAPHHRGELAAEMLHPPRHELYFDAEGGEADDGLVPVSLDPGLSSAVAYLYGGGYLTGLWGDRKLAMLRAAEELIAAAAPAEVRRIGSGLQAERAWLSALSQDDVDLIRSFELLGTRDPRSGRALEELGCGNVPESGDDAIAILGQLPAAGAPEDEEDELRVNLHCTDKDWVTGDGEKLVGFCVDLVAELGRRTGSSIVAQPLVAYRDARVDEMPTSVRLAEALEQRGIAVRAPLVMRPSSLARAAGEIGCASLTVACSYHVALTSLMLGLPTVTIRDNPYYAQKSAGLLDAFGQPPQFATGSDADPATLAGLLAAAALDPEGASALRQQLRVDASAQRLRRAAVEAELLGRITGATSAKGGTGPAVQAVADRRVRAAEQHRLDAEQRAAAAAERATLAEQGVAHLEGQLGALLGSSSWRLTAPLRRLGARRRNSGQ
jgi:polysaccharide pyruvyl transferase WcaK-like protein